MDHRIGIALLLLALVQLAECADWATPTGGSIELAPDLIEHFKRAAAEPEPVSAHAKRAAADPETVSSHVKRAATATKSVSKKVPSFKQNVTSAMAAKAIDIGGELAEKAAEKLFEKIGEAGDRANEYLENGASVDIQPGNGFVTDDLIAPPAWRIEAHAEANDPDDKISETANTYPGGIGPVMFSGCYGTGYQPGDPCYKGKKPSQSTCADMMEGAGFIGVGFDGTGMYGPESRKMSIIQRNCAALSSYQGEDVPDTMNVHGIYETRSNMFTFSSREEYSSHLQVEAGVSGSYMFFSAGVTAAYGSVSRTNQQSYLSVMDIDVIRYEIFKDEVKASDLSTNFVKEFMDLPEYYLDPGAPVKYQEFILRWGTHYIKSATFGGRLQFRKVTTATSQSTVDEFAVEAKVDYDAFFASMHFKSSTKGKTSNMKQTSYSAFSVEALGGDQEVAAIVSDGGTPTTRTDLVNWLNSIPTYPKPFKFLIAPIADLLYFQKDDLFPGESDEWDCNKKVEAGTNYYFVDTVADGVTTRVKRFCNFKTTDEFMNGIKLRRNALKRATSIYLSEGLISTKDLSVPAGSMNCKLQDLQRRGATDKPTWTHMKSGKSFSVIFDLERDISGGLHGKTIAKDFIAQMHFFSKHWFVEDGEGRSPVSNSYDNGGSGIVTGSYQKISVLGLVLTFMPQENLLMLTAEDFSASLNIWPELEPEWQNRYLARVEWPVFSGTNVQRALENVATFPCNTRWSNVQAIKSHDEGMCLYFTATSEGTIFTAFAAVPDDRQTWYFVEISSTLAAIKKYNHVLTETTTLNARGLGDSVIHQSYFVCVKSDSTSTLIEYGKYRGDIDNRLTYLSYNDVHDPIQPTFYSFGSGDKLVTILESSTILRTDAADTNCGTGTTYDSTKKYCKLNCHAECNPDFGCRISSDGQPTAFLCTKCLNQKRMVDDTEYECIGPANCPKPVITVDGKQVCSCVWFNNMCLETCPSGREMDPVTRACSIGTAL